MKDHRLFVIFGIVLVDMLSFSLVIPLLPEYAAQFGANAFLTGLMYSAYPLMQVVATPLLGRLSDVYGRKPILLLSIAGTASALVLLGLSNALWMLFASRMLDGLTGGNISVAQAYMADITAPSERGKAFGLIGAAFGLGFIVGPLTGGLLSAYGLSVPPFVAAGLAVVNLLLVAFVLRESLTPEQRAASAASPGHGFSVQQFTEAMRMPRVAPLLWVWLVVGFTFALFEGGFSNWARAALGLDSRNIGFVLAYVGVISVIIQLGLIGPLTKRYKDGQLIVAAAALAAVMLAMWGLFPSLWALIALMPLLSLGMSVTSTILRSAFTKAVPPDEIGGIVGLSTSVSSLARMPAPAIAGGLIQVVGIWAPGLLAGLLTAAIVPLAYVRLIKRPAQALLEHSEPVGAATEAFTPSTAQADPEGL